MNSSNPRDLQTEPARIDFYTQSQTVHIAADDTPAPRFGA